MRFGKAASVVVEALLAGEPGPPGEAIVLAGRAVVDAGTVGVTSACRQVMVTALLAAMSTGVLFLADGEME